MVSPKPEESFRKKVEISCFKDHLEAENKKNMEVTSDSDNINFSGMEMTE